MRLFKNFGVDLDTLVNLLLMPVLPYLGLPLCPLFALITHLFEFFRSKFAVDWKLSHITKKRLLKLFFFVFNLDNGCVDKKKRIFFSVLTLFFCNYRLYSFVGAVDLYLQQIIACCPFDVIS